MLKRIGILTLLRHRNPGTYFQALGTWQALQAALPDSRVEFIDLTPHDGPAFSRQDLARSLTSLRDGRQLWHYWHAWRSLPRSARRLATRDRGMAARFIESLDYDLVVLGSDVVLKIAGAEAAAAEPPMYWLPPLSRSRKVMLGSSCDTTRYANLPVQQREQVQTSARSFELCYVRDDATHQLLRELGVEERRLRIVPDPAFHLALPPVLQQRSRKVFASRVGLGKHPLLGLNLGVAMAEWKSSLVGALAASGFEVISLRNYPGTRYLGPLTPWEWAGIFPCFDVVLTFSFHETLFCLRHGVPVVNIVATDKILETTSGWSKGRYLLRQFDLEATNSVDPEARTSLGVQAICEQVRQAMAAFDRERVVQQSCARARAYGEAVSELKAKLLGGGAHEAPAGSRAGQ